MRKSEDGVKQNSEIGVSRTVAPCSLKQKSERKERKDVDGDEDLFKSSENRVVAWRNWNCMSCPVEQWIRRR